jgi:galactoside O-acetyltransferase
MPFLTPSQLKQLGLKKYGSNVLISNKASIYSPDCISIGSNVRIDDYCILSGEITLGNNIHISAYNALYGKFGIEMEDFTGLSPRCTIFSASDDFSGDYMISPMVPEELTNVEGGKVIIKRFCQIGSNSVILPNVIINEGTAIGALSLVKYNTEGWTIYGGNPLKKIKPREKGILKLYNKISEQL